MNVPDYVKPIIGYRMWGLASFLMSVGVCGEMWYPGQPMTARCKVSYPKVSKARFALAGAMRIARGDVRWGLDLFRGHHESPHIRCTCGIYAMKRLDHVLVRFRCAVYGEVYLWGKVVEHEYGWRAQYAYPKTLILNVEAGSRVGDSLEGLTAYGADIYIGNTLLWSKQRGYTEDGREVLRVIVLPRSLLLYFLEVPCNVAEPEAKLKSAGIDPDAPASPPAQTLP